MLRHVSSLLRAFAVTARCLAILAGLACNADHIVSIDAGTGSRRVTAGIGDVVDIRLWAGALGMYGSQPTISTPALSFVGVSIDDPPTPGGPSQLFRFRAVSRGTALITFTPVSNAPIVVDTVVVH